jgi:hypothetical protein
LTLAEAHGGDRALLGAVAEVDGEWLVPRRGDDVFRAAQPHARLAPACERQVGAIAGEARRGPTHANR